MWIPAFACIFLAAYSIPASANDWDATQIKDENGDDVSILSTLDMLSSRLGEGADLHDNLKGVKVFCVAGTATVQFEGFVRPGGPAKLRYELQRGYTSHTADLSITPDGFWLNNDDARDFIRRTRSDDALSIHIDVDGGSGAYGLISMRGFDWRVSQIKDSCGDIEGSWYSSVFDLFY